MVPKWYDKAEEMFLKGDTYADIGRAIDVDRKRVSYWIRKMGHKTNPKRIRNSKTISRKYHFKEDIFETIDTEEKAYWLGFLYADGNVSEYKNDISVGLAEKDAEHLSKLKMFLQTNAPIKKKKKKHKNKTYIGYSLTVTSQQTKKDLIDKGCMPRKSMNLSFPDKKQVPKNLLPHFVRGYFDGDGSVTHANKGRQISAEILGTREFIEELIEWVGVDVNIHSFKHSPTTFRVQYFGPKAEVFFKKIYQNASVSLSRKYERYVNFRPS